MPLYLFIFLGICHFAKRNVAFFFNLLTVINKSITFSSDFVLSYLAELEPEINFKTMSLGPYLSIHGKVLIKAQFWLIIRLFCVWAYIRQTLIRISKS